MIERTPEDIINELRRKLEWTESMRVLGQQNVKTSESLRMKDKADQQARILTLENNVEREKTRADGNYREWKNQHDALKRVEAQRDMLDALCKQLKSDIRDMITAQDQRNKDADERYDDLIVINNTNATWILAMDYAAKKVTGPKRYQRWVNYANEAFEDQPAEMFEMEGCDDRNPVD